MTQTIEVAPDENASETTAHETAAQLIELEELNRVAGEIIATLDRIHRIDREIIGDLKAMRRTVAEAAVIHEPQ